MKIENCSLCIATRDISDDIKNIPIENTRLLISSNFVVMPCVGPFTEGQLMIVGKEHIPNLSKMSLDQLVECFDLISLVSKKTGELYSNDILYAEHGAFNDVQKSGACVVHTHIHCIPGFEKDEATFIKVLPLLYEGFDKSEILRLSIPYILTITGNDNLIHIYDASDVPSQMIRKILLSNRGIMDDWNWRVNHRFDLIENTVERWTK